jgi:cysteinyl-tRNA synthetase
MDKLELLLDWDQILGLDLVNVQTISEIPEIIKQMVVIRENLRKEGKFVEADTLRLEIEQKGYFIKDTATGTIISLK